MKLKPEIAVIGLFIIFAILIFGYGISGNETFNQLFQIFVFIIIPSIILIIVLHTIIKTPKNELIDNFKNQHIIIQLLTVITIISILYELITTQTFSWSAIPLLILIILQFGIWFFKKEQ